MQYISTLSDGGATFNGYAMELKSVPVQAEIKFYWLRLEPGCTFPAYATLVDVLYRLSNWNPKLIR